MMRMMTAALRVLALVLAITAAACGLAPSSARLDPRLEKLIPADTNMMLEVNLAQLRDTSIYREHLSQASPAELDDFTRRTGIDLRRDVDQLVLASDGKNSLLLAEGRFHPDDARQRLRAAGATSTPVAGTDVFQEGPNGVAFIDSSVAVGGTAAGVRAALETQKNGGGIPAELRPALDAIASRDQIRAAMTGGAVKFPAQGNLQNLAQLALSIEQASAGVDLQNGLDLQARADCRSDEDARRVHDALRGFIAIARMSSPANRPDLIRVFDAINVVRENRQVRVTASLSPQDLNAFLSLWSKR